MAAFQTCFRISHSSFFSVYQQIRFLSIVEQQKQKAKRLSAFLLHLFIEFHPEVNRVPVHEQVPDHHRDNDRP